MIITNNEIRQLFLDQAVKYHSCGLSKYSALKQTADCFYRNSIKQGLELPTLTPQYRERIFSFIFGDDTSLTAQELELACRCFHASLTQEPYGEGVFKEYHNALEQYHIYVKGLEEETAELCKFDKGCFPIQILDRIDKYIEYRRTMEVEECLIYAGVYNIGWADGIRAERARRKKQDKHTGKELCNV